MSPTHEVFNQAPALTGYDVADDPALLDALRREGAGWATEAVHELGRLAGSGRVQELGRQANENPPALRTHDRFGNRIDEVEFHPAWPGSSSRCWRPRNTTSACGRREPSAGCSRACR